MLIQETPPTAMRLLSLDAIRAQIRTASTRELDSGQLRQLLAHRLERLHNAIRLPEQDAAAALEDFVLRYLEHVPEFIEAIAGITREAGIDHQVEPLLSIACDYFLSPPDLIDGHLEMEALLDKAYLAHRLLEEMNDRFIGYGGIPLVPMDTTRANVIAHELIGEPFANELDQAVLFSAELLLNEHRFEGPNFDRYIERHKQQGWSEELQRWPCLATKLEIDLRLGSRT